MYYEPNFTLPQHCIPIILCVKRIEDRLAGDWKLDKTYKKGLVNRDYFQTGYEDGLFILFESGSASYVSSLDTLSGFWKSDFYTRLQDNAADDDYDTKTLKYLEIYLANFNCNKIIHWRFDDFDFKDNSKRIKAVEFSLGRDRYYEFVKQ